MKQDLPVGQHSEFNITSTSTWDMGHDSIEDWIGSLTIFEKTGLGSCDAFGWVGSFALDYRACARQRPDGALAPDT
jgi:hypothetical protein